MKPTCAAAALLLLLSCAPPAEECSATRPCAAGFSCEAGRCEAIDAGGGGGVPENLLPNPGFETGDPPDDWMVTHGKLSVVHNAPHSGLAAARISDTTSAVDLNLWLQPDAVTSPGTRTFCVRAWMRGSRVGRLGVRKVQGGGGVEDNYSSPVTADWVVVPPPTYGAMKITGAGEDRYLLRAFVPDPTPADWLEVDDVELWQSSDGGCVER